jgi:hypothetical protein
MDYYPEIDAVELDGQRPVENLGRSPLAAPTAIPGSSGPPVLESDAEMSDLESLPDELLYHIAMFLPQADVIATAATCPRLFEAFYSLHGGFVECDFQPLWASLNDALLAVVIRATKRGEIKAASFAWGGPRQGLTVEGMSRFLSHAGAGLKVLRLVCFFFPRRPHFNLQTRATARRLVRSCF